MDALAGLRRILAMTEELLLLARIEDAHLPIHPVRSSLRDIVDGAMHTLGRIAQRRGTEVNIAMDADLSATADPQLLQRVVENLLDNALRHTPRGGRISVEGCRTDGVSLRFANSGTPIPPDDRTHIFEKFAQSSGTVSRGANVGLGLHFCSVVAAAHGGTLRVDETAEWPVVFTLSLPA
jgi:signal transduction histidine kinase